MDWVSDDDYAGTKGQSLRMEAVQIELTGEIKEKYDVYYTTYVQNIGWLGWAKNGQSSGTEAFHGRSKQFGSAGGERKRSAWRKSGIFCKRTSIFRIIRHSTYSDIRRPDDNGFVES